MSACAVCSTPFADEAKSCPVCGTSVAFITSSTPITSTSPSSPMSTPSTFELPASAPTGNRKCPQCHKAYDATYLDEYCECGTELVANLEASLSPEVVQPTLDVHPAIPSPPVRPQIGTTCLVVYSADRQPIFYHELSADVTLIGRSDPIRGDFPDVDISALVDAATAKGVSRKHAIILRSRENNQYSLRPLAKNTGTQLERELIPDLQDRPLLDGMRIVLGGSVRMKFEVIK